MVRTRGLARALGSGTGRGTVRDEHDVDVPWRRRPTASAHRQRVQVTVAEDVPPQVTEDLDDLVTEGVVDMTEDVHDVEEDVDAADVAADGAEESPERPELKLVSHGRKVDKIGSPAPEIEGLVAGTGLSPLIGCSVVIGDPGLISAFTERWHRETNTFHLPVGELTITLDDVACLLHLPITGALHRFEPQVVDEVVLLMTELLEVSSQEARAETSSTYVHVVHLGAFRDLGQSGGYAWGVAVLVHMYDQLIEASQTPTRQMGGYLTLLQCWIYEYFGSVHQCVTDDAYAETTPRASRWLMMKAHMKGIKGAPYRARLDALTITNVSWLPYSDHQAVRGFDLISCY
ncbi:Protein MAINTENANCE OF MERISTEMS [Glycine max]|nr:Protein MAINTENANCE OF MERISTEMS [Glycine max]